MGDSDNKNKFNFNFDLNKRRRRRRGRSDHSQLYQYIALGVVAVVVVVLLVLVIRSIAGSLKNRPDEEAGQLTASGPEAVNAANTVSNEEQAALEQAQRAKEVVDSYENLGLVQVSGYLNIRETPSAANDSNIIGKLNGDSVCEVLETQDEWMKISSGGIEGYIHGQYVLTGEEARAKAVDLVAKRAFIQVNNLNIRVEPSLDAEIMGQALINERYEVVEERGDGWIQIPEGYIAADYASVDYALNEARKLDLKATVFNMYDNMGICRADNYVNVREEASEEGKIIGKLPGNAAGNILETTEDGKWYKIQSGPITGFVSTEFIVTGEDARQRAADSATLMAIVSTDMLNVRTEPSTDAPIWTQLANRERYEVKQQMDGWIEIDLEEDTTAYVATDFVDVQYALAEAIKFSPLEDKVNAEAALRTKIVNYAVQFCGNPYVWGGTSLTRGADCSGFTQSVLKNFGVSIPRVSRDQAKAGKKISSDDMRPGDLIFYANSRGTVNHVSMYIGNGQIVHAASRKSGIKISTWNYRRPVAIRNVID